MKAPERVRFTVAGVTFEGRQEVLARLHKAPGPIAARLERDPSNHYDPNAIKVFMGAQGSTWQHVGFAPRELAAKLAPRMDAGATVQVIVGSIYDPRYDRAYGVDMRIEVRDKAPAPPAWPGHQVDF